MRQKSLWRFTSADPSASGPFRLAASSRSLHCMARLPSRLVRPATQRTTQQQDYEVQREMDVRMVEIGVRWHLSD